MMKIGTTHLARRSMLVAVAIVASTALWSTPVGATPVVDQAFTEGTNLGANISEGCRYVGQTFTAGITGRLTAVNVDVRTDLYSGVHPLRVAIRTTWRDKPYGEPLGYRYLYDSQAPLDRLITFPQRIRVVAGRQYAIVLSYRGAPLGGTEVLGLWEGSTGDLYPRGRMIAGDCPSSGNTAFWFLPESWAPYDVHFRTYVNPW